MSTEIASPPRWSVEADWPYTTRLMPWLLAGFVVMLFMLPFDVAELPVSLPVEARLDRVVLIVIFTLWICTLATGGRLAPQIRWSPIHATAIIFFGVAALSVALNLAMLVNLAEDALAIKKLALLASFVALFCFVASVLRPSEVRPFIKLIVGLACVTAIGVIVEERVHTNYFYEWAANLLPGFSIPPAPVTQGFDEIGRLKITGPTTHGLAVATMLAMLIPFTLTSMMEATRRRRLYGLITTGVLLAGAFATQRKTAFMAPAAAVLVLIAYRPSAMVKLLPYGVVMVIMVHFLSPGSLGSMRDQIFTGKLTTVSSTTDRTADYDAVRLDVVSKLELGRGYGTYDPQRYRFLDNMYLQLMITTGVIGAFAYVLMILSVGWVGHRTARARGPGRAVGVATVAAAVTFAVTNALYDTLAFPHAPYLFMLIAGLAVASSPGVVRVPAKAPVSHRMAPLPATAPGV